jgi:signal transduction histidine kinase
MNAPGEKPMAGSLGGELQTYAQAGVLRDFRAGDVIFSAGEPGDGFYLVESGSVQICAVVGDNEPRVLATIGAGDFFGEMAVLDDAPRSATARAAVDTKARFLSRDELLQLLDRNPRLALNLIREFSKRMRAVNQKFMHEIINAERLAVVGQFAGTIVHDFKNPLTVISLAAELACGQRTTGPARDKARLRIMRQVDSMTSMLDELIEFTRPSGRQLALARTDFALYLLPLMDEMAAEIAGRNVTLDSGTPPQGVDVRIEPKRISRLFQNLIYNAVDEMSDGGKIMLRYHVTDSELRVDVEDTGDGIAPEIAAQLFQPFATHGKAHGTGLGLSICKKIAEDHGGRIWAHSEPGHGATFSFTLPLGR